ncbi:MAG TPA: Gfo/Idh/MocA family oxidoreductase [Bacillota bacterium]|nr:Gfo/Idh/MocA family oxidoreductase [Bacillota bacterium]
MDILWGILGTANIARSSFLPGLRAAGGGGRAFAVASRTADRAKAYAAENGLDHGVAGYETLLADDRIRAVYIPLPNSLHAEWTVRALRAGKAVLCEKPLCADLPETEAVVKEPGLLWEAFVFPFHAQMARVRELIQSGAIGELREIHSSFHFRLRSRANIRLDPGLAGGALNDVGCYCVHLATQYFGELPAFARASAKMAPEGVDEELQGVLSFPGDRRLLLSCGLDRGRDCLSRLLGTEGEIRLSNPFHPGPADTIEVHAGGRVTIEHPTGSEPSFAPAIRHIHAVLAEGAPPRHLAREDSLHTAAGMALLRAAL